jgi:hypothetical protein
MVTKVAPQDHTGSVVSALAAWACAYARADSGGHGMLAGARRGMSASARGGDGQNAWVGKRTGRRTPSI